MVLDHGRIIERGTHDDLIAKKGTYYQLYTCLLYTSEHRAGGTGGMPGRERAEFVGRHALSNQLVFKAASPFTTRTQHRIC